MKNIFIHWILPLPLGILTYCITRLFLLIGAASNSMESSNLFNDPEINSLYLDMWKNGGLSAGYFSGTWWIFLTEGLSTYLGARVAFWLIPKYRKKIMIGICAVYLIFLSYLVSNIPSEVEITFRNCYTLFCYSVFPLGGIIIGYLTTDNKIQSKR